jgi:hypothetical protein
MSRLTSSQRIILSTAANREGGSVLPLPESIKVKGTALEALRHKGFLAEKEGQRETLVITDAGLQAIGLGSNPHPAERAGPKSSRPKKRGGKTKRASGNNQPGLSPLPATSQPITKQARLIELLSRENGATIAEAVEVTGWQPHSVRGAISGTLKKKLGLAVTSTKVDGRGRTYQIVRQH